MRSVPSSGKYGDTKRTPKHICYSHMEFTFPLPHHISRPKQSSTFPPRVFVLLPLTPQVDALDERLIITQTLQRLQDSCPRCGPTPPGASTQSGCPGCCAYADIASFRKNINVEKQR